MLLKTTKRKRLRQHYHWLLPYTCPSAFSSLFSTIEFNSSISSLLATWDWIKMWFYLRYIATHHNKYFLRDFQTWKFLLVKSTKHRLLTKTFLSLTWSFCFSLYSAQYKYSNSVKLNLYSKINTAALKVHPLTASWERFTPSSKQTSITAYLEMMEFWDYFWTSLMHVSKLQRKE